MTPALKVEMGATSQQERVLLKIGGSSSDFLCNVVEEENDLLTLKLPTEITNDQFNDDMSVAIVRTKYNQTKACSGVFVSIDGETVVFKLERRAAASSSQDDAKLTECQLPAMFRPRTQDGFYGCWRGAFIVKHGPDRLHIQVEEDQTVPKHTELMFSPIGSETGASSGRSYGDDGSVINASDVRSRRIRVRAVTRDVIPSGNPGTVTLVMDITRTLYRTA